MKVLQVFHHEKRLCACGCGRHFRPTDTIGPTSTERFVNAYHAVGPKSPLYLYDPDTARRMKQDRRSNANLAPQNTTPRVGRPTPRPSRDAATTEARFGPIRQVIRVVGRRTTAKTTYQRVVFDCGHERTIGLNSTQARCSKCAREKRR